MVFSPTAPHFFKIILQQTPDNTYTKLQIPKAFWVKYCGSLSSQVFLKLPCGSTWEVGLTKSSDGNVWIEEGWNKFAQHCSLSRGNLLVFRYEGNSLFDVTIFDKDTTEIDYPSNPSHFEKHRVDNTKDDISIKILDKSTLPCSASSHKKMKTSPCDKSEVKFDLSDKVCGESPVPRGMEPEKYTRKQRLTGKVKAKALMRAEGFKSKDPFFFVPMQPSVVGAKFHLNVPFHFARTYLSKSQDVILKVQGGRTWSVMYSYKQYEGSSRYSRFCCGWKEFVQDNDLKVGDVCAFVLRKNIGVILFKVVIFYENGAANSPMLPGEEKIREEQQLYTAPNMSRSATLSGTVRNPCVKVESFNNYDEDKTSIISYNLNAKREQQNIKVERPLGPSQFVSKNPYFQVTLRSTHVHRRRLCIPMSFARDYLEGKTQTIILWVGEECRYVNLIVNGAEHKFSSGWCAFVRDNSLQVGDVCIFELLKGYQAEMKVHIFRQTGLIQQ